MWARGSHIFEPLTMLTSNKIEFKWTEVKQKVFKEIKQIVPCNNLLACQHSNKLFWLHTNTSNL